MPNSDIVNQTFPVNALSYTRFPFYLSSQSRIKSWFSASGGHNDIDVVVLDASELANYDKNRFRSYYKWGYITFGKIDLPLPAGSYYIIFNNFASLFANKLVTAKIGLAALGSN